jgi:hypothetical protein
VWCGTANRSAVPSCTGRNMTRRRCCTLHVCCTLCASCSLLAHVVQQSCWMATLYAALNVEECSGKTWPHATGSALCRSTPKITVEPPGSLVLNELTPF